MTYAIIGGRSTYLKLFNSEGEPIDTPYGQATVYNLSVGNRSFIFLPRHGQDDNQDARDTNYRANLFALKLKGVTNIISISSVGTCDYAHKLGSFCLMNDFLDFTFGRCPSFLREHRVQPHAGMEDVFDPSMNDGLEHLIKKKDIQYAGRCIYACTNGPRFETASEVRMMRMLGAQIIGMALIPEAPLARELGMKYASIGIICNYSTGLTQGFDDTSIDNLAEIHKEAAFEIAKEYIARVK